MTSTPNHLRRSCRTITGLALLFALGAFGWSDLSRVNASERDAAAAATDQPLVVVAFASADRLRVRLANGTATSRTP